MRIPADLHEVVVDAGGPAAGDVSRGATMAISPVLGGAVFEVVDLVGRDSDCRSCQFSQDSREQRELPSAHTKTLHDLPIGKPMRRALYSRASQATRSERGIAPAPRV